MLLLPTNQTTLLVNVTNPGEEKTFGALQSLFQEYGNIKKLLL